MSDHKKSSLVIASSALAVSIVSAYFSHSSLNTNKDAARAQLFSNFQQQYSSIASQFPEQLYEPSWHPVIGSPDWWKLKRYWDLCYVEWYATKRLDEDLYGPLWDNFYANAISDGLEINSLRSVLADRVSQQGLRGPGKDEFYSALAELARKKGLSIQSK